MTTLQLTTIAISVAYLIGLLLTSKYVIEKIIPTPNMNHYHERNYDLFFKRYKEAEKQQMQFLLIWPFTVAIWLYHTEFTINWKYAQWAIYWTLAGLVLAGIAGYALIVLVVLYGVNTIVHRLQYIRKKV